MNKEERFAVISSCNGGRYPWMVSDSKHEFELYCRTSEEGAKLKEMLSSELEKHRWIPVSERLPITEKEMKCFDYKTVDVIGYDGRSVRPIEVQAGATGEFWITLDHDSLEITEITHWMKLPIEPPK